MANEIKDLFSASAAFVMTLAGLTSSTSGVGRQSTLIDNTSTRFREIEVYLSIKLGTSPANNTSIYVFVIRGDKHGTPYRTDGAGASDAGLTILNCSPLGIIKGKASAATGDVLYGEFKIVTPGPEWGIALYHDTNAALDGTEGNHIKHWVGIDPEVQ